MDKFIDVGEIVNTHGLKGEVKVNPRTDFPEVFESFKKVYTENKEEHKVMGIKYHKNQVILKLSGIDSIDDAERAKGKVLYVPKDLFSDLPNDTYLVADIVGLTVKDDSLQYGKVEDVITTGSNDVYVVRPPLGKLILIPAIKDVIKEININEGYIHITMPKGLLD